MTEEAAARTALGREGEDIAQQYLTARGMVLLDRNWRCRDGEIDLVLRDGDTVVVCEVKTRRTTTFGSPVEAVSRVKLARLRRLAGWWMAVHGVRAAGVRLDVVGLLLDPDGNYAVDHRPGVGQ